MQQRYYLNVGNTSCLQEVVILNADVNNASMESVIYLNGARHEKKYQDRKAHLNHLEEN